MSSVVVGFGGKTKYASSLSACRRVGQNGCAATGASNDGQAFGAASAVFGCAAALGALLAERSGVCAGPCMRGGADGALGSGRVTVATEASSATAGGLAGGADDSQPAKSRQAAQATAWCTS